MSRMIVLLRAVNVGAQRKVPMAELRALATGEGFTEVETYIQSGNLVLTAKKPVSSVVAALERAIERHFGFTVDVIARTADQWDAYAGGSPFADAQRDRPNHLLLGLAAKPLNEGVAEALRARAKGGERVEVVGDAIWFDYPNGNVARSKLTPAAIDKAAGSPVTARNWNTVLKLHAMARKTV